MNKKTNVFGALCLGISLCGFAQQQQADSTKVEQLDEVVIADSRFKLKREHSGKTVIKISKQEIERNQGRTVSELINTKSGIEINGSRSVAGQNLSSFVRAGNNRQVLVLIDGIQINDPSLPSNELDLRLLDLNTIESIEIIKGAASTLYGNAAATAVINITTKKTSKESLSGSFLTVVGTNQTQDDLNYNAASFTNSVSVSGSTKTFNYLANFGNQYANGLSASKGENAEKDAYSRYNASVKLEYEFNKTIDITAFAGLDKFKTDIDGFPAPTYAFADTNDEYVSKQKRVAVAPKLKYGNGSLHVNAAFSEIERAFIWSGTQPSPTKAKSYIIDAYNKYVIDESFYTIVGFNYGDFRSEFASKASYINRDPYINVVYVSSFGLNMNAGARLNNHSEYGSHVVYSLNPSYTAALDGGYVKLLGSFATSFIAPNLSQLFGNFGANPELEPEENRTIEGGIEYNIKKGLRLSGVYFNRKEDQTIIWGTVGYENAEGKARVHGVEVEAEIDLIENVSINTNYTFTELKDGIRIRLPKHKANASVGYNFCENTFASLGYQFVGDRMEIGNKALKSFSLFDLYFSHKIINDKVKLFTSVTNVFNEDYFEISGYTTKGRNINLGLNINL